MRYISIDYIIKLHEKLIIATGGSNGLRDKGLLESAIENSKATFSGEIYIKVLRKNVLIFVIV